MSLVSSFKASETTTGLFDHFLDIDFSGEVLSSLIVMLIIGFLSIIIGILASRQNPLKKPKGLLLLVEIGVDFFDGYSRSLIGNKLPGMGGFIFGIATYLSISFIFGLTGLPSPMGNLAIPLSLGLIAFGMIHITSIRFTKWRYFKRYIDPIPFFLPVNLISMWAPLLSLTLRLFGNAIAGWALMTILYSVLEALSGVVFSFLNGWGIWNQLLLAPFITPILHAYFDLFSGLIQTVVFISLTTIFVGQEVPDIENKSLNMKLNRKGGN